MSMPIIPPFAIKASYQNSQFGGGSIYTPGVPSVFAHLVTPPTSGTDAENAAIANAEAKGFAGYSAANEVIVVTVVGAPTGGTFTLLFGDDETTPIAYNASAATVASAVNALPSIGVGTGGTNEVQTVTVTGAPTGGTFTLTYSGQTTGPIAYNATAAAVQTALTGLSNVGTGNVAVTGASGGPYTVTFQGTLADTDVAQMTATASLTGGTTPGVTVATQTAGVARTPNVAASGSAGGPYTLTFSGQLADEALEGFSADGSGLTGGTDPGVTVAITTLGTGAFVNEPKANVTRQFDPLVNFYDSASNNFGQWDVTA
jgi:hypothetical protein